MPGLSAGNPASRAAAAEAVVALKGVLVIGQLGGKHWSAVVANREDRIRIISARRAREEKVAIDARLYLLPYRRRWRPGVRCG